VIAVSTLLAVAGLSVVLAVQPQVGSDPNADNNKSQLNGKQVPQFSVRQLNGSKLTDRDLAGRAVIVNFWNSWCIPCREELPTLKQFSSRHKGDPTFLFLGIVRDDTESAVRRYVAAEGIDWTIALDPGSQASLAFGTRGQPETYAISPDGTVVAFQFGPTRLADLEAMLTRARAGAR
jgi:cytochrome c biogenesis protein CcmG/thiol:disulfide interchange protein DsbE